MSLSVADKISVAKVSQVLAAQDIATSYLRLGFIDTDLPRKLYDVRKSVEWLYDLAPSNADLTGSSNFMYSLCGRYQAKAQAIINAGGGGIPVTPVVLVTEPIQFVVGSGAQYVPNNGDSEYNNPELAGNNNYLIASNSDGGYLVEGTNFDYLTSGGFELLNGRTFFTGEIFTLFFY